MTVLTLKVMNCLQNNLLLGLCVCCVKRAQWAACDGRLHSRAHRLVDATYVHSAGKISLKLAFHDADTDTDTDILADILARIVSRISVCRSACHRNNFRKSRVSDVSAKILARIFVLVSLLASWNASLITHSAVSASASLIGDRELHAIGLRWATILWWGIQI